MKLKHPLDTYPLTKKPGNFPTPPQTKLETYSLKRDTRNDKGLL